MSPDLTYMIRVGQDRKLLTCQALPMKLQQNKVVYVSQLSPERDGIGIEPGRIFAGLGKILETLAGSFHVK